MFDIEGFITRQFDDYSYYGNPRSDIRVNCPFCAKDYKQHLYVSLDKKTAHCFKCGYAASWITFVMDVTGLPYYKAVGELYVEPKLRGDLTDTVLERMNQAIVPSVPKIVVEHYDLPADYRQLSIEDTGKLPMRAKAYLTVRGFGPKYWRRYKLGVAESIGYRVIIPIERGYWQARRIIKFLEPKYMNPKEEARHILFNAQAILMYEEVVICEGAFSAMAVGGNAIALIGKEATEEKIGRLLDSRVKRFVIALEPEAFSTMGTLADILVSDGRKVIIWRYMKGDPADPASSMEVLEYGLKSKVFLMMNSGKPAN